MAATANEERSEAVAHGRGTVVDGKLWDFVGDFVGEFVRNFVGGFIGDFLRDFLTEAS